MEELVKIAQRAKQTNVMQLALKEARNNSGLIADLNRQQLVVGENSRGQRIGRYTTPRYSAFKKRIGSQAPLGVPDLKLSGRLHKEIEANITPTKITIESKVPYDIFQERRYGKEIHNLQDQNWEEVEFKVLIETRKEYLDKIGL